MVTAEGVWRILFVSLEFRAGAFSGNGVYAQAQVRSLQALGHAVLVVSGKPKSASDGPSSLRSAGISLYEVPVPVWGRLDAGASWREFAAGISDTDSPIAAAIIAFSPHLLLFVDWSALPAARAVRALLPLVPLVYLNYRVFSRTAFGADLELVQGFEEAAMREAVLTIALSRSDAAYLQRTVAGGDPALPPPKVLLPALREDMRRLSSSSPAPPGIGSSCNMHAVAPGASTCIPKVVSSGACTGTTACSTDGRSDGTTRSTTTSDSGSSFTDAVRGMESQNTKELTPQPSAKQSEHGSSWAQSRPYITCCVRLSGEKEPHRFVDLVEALMADGTLQRLGLTPLLVAGTTADQVAQDLKTRLRKAAPHAVIKESFLDAAALAHLYRQTRLNVHPATYDAFGMTIVEAASQGAPSLVHDGHGAVGATDLLRAGQGEVLLLDLNAVDLNEKVQQILTDEQRLAVVGTAARLRAAEWDEAANARQLIALVGASISDLP